MGKYNPPYQFPTVLDGFRPKNANQPLVGRIKSHSASVLTEQPRTTLAEMDAWNSCVLKGEQKACVRFAKGNSSQRVLQKMEGKLKQLMSLMYVDGAVNKGTGAKLLDLASAVLGTMLKLDDQEAENMEAMAMQIIGKLATMGLGLEVVGAIPGIVKAASEIRKGHRGYTLTKTHTAGLNAIEHFLDSNDKKLLDAILQE